MVCSLTAGIGYVLLITELVNDWRSLIIRNTGAIDILNSMFLNKGSPMLGYMIFQVTGSERA